MDWTPVYIGGGVVLNWLILYFWQPWTTAYAGEKGKNVARKEDLNEILAEVRAVTIAQKGIEHRLAGDLWNTQVVWQQKREIYAEVIGTLERMVDARIRLEHHFHVFSTSQDQEDSREHKERYLKELDKFIEGYNNLVLKLGTLNIFGCPEVISAVLGYLYKRPELPTIPSKEWLNVEKERLSGLLPEVTILIKKDLGVK